jgi:hypothetical protein
MIRDAPLVSTKPELKLARRLATGFARSIMTRERFSGAKKFLHPNRLREDPESLGRNGGLRRDGAEAGVSLPDDPA